MMSQPQNLKLKNLNPKKKIKSIDDIRKASKQMEGSAAEEATESKKVEAKENKAK